MFLPILNVLVNSKSLDDSSLGLQILPKEACDSMLVSHAGFNEGRTTFSANNTLNTSPTDLERSRIIFKSFKQLVEVTESEKFKSITSGMSCLMIIAQMHNNWEASQLIEIVNGFKISKRYLIILIDTLNTTMLGKRTINFNVIINHKEPGTNIMCASR